MSKLQTLVLIATIMGLSQAAMTPEQVSRDRSRSPRDRLLDHYGDDSDKLQQRIDFLRGETKKYSLLLEFATPGFWSTHKFESEYVQICEELRDLLKLKIEQQPEAELAELKRAAAAEMTCPDQHMDTYSHELTPMTHYGFLHARECDECGKEASRGDVLLHCATCDFHLCQACHEYKADPVRRELVGVETVIKQLQFSKGGRGRLGHDDEDSVETMQEFEAADTNGDGVIDAQEYAAMKKASQDAKKAVPRHIAMDEEASTVESRYSASDSPKSGVNPFDTPKSGVNPFDTLQFGVNF